MNSTIKTIAFDPKNALRIEQTSLVVQTGHQRFDIGLGLQFDYAAFVPLIEDYSIILEMAFSHKRAINACFQTRLNHLLHMPAKAPILLNSYIENPFFLTTQVDCNRQSPSIQPITQKMAPISVTYCSFDDAARRINQDDPELQDYKKFQYSFSKIQNKLRQGLPVSPKADIIDSCARDIFSFTNPHTNQFILEALGDRSISAYELRANFFKAKKRRSDISENVISKEEQHGYHIQRDITSAIGMSAQLHGIKNNIPLLYYNTRLDMLMTEPHKTGTLAYPSAPYRKFHMAFNAIQLGSCHDTQGMPYFSHDFTRAMAQDINQHRLFNKLRFDD